MGLPFSRILVDPQNRYLEFSQKQEYFKRITEWKIGYNNYLVAEVSWDRMGGEFTEEEKEFFTTLKEWGIKGLDYSTNKLYELI